jgi:shikimate kinase
MEAPRVVVLLGPKGSGKTHVGTLVERELGVRFLRVEPIFLEHQRTSPLAGRARDAGGYAKVAAAVADLLARAPCVALESTGASPAFAPFLAALRARWPVTVVAIRAPLDRCAARVRTRDPVPHIPVSDERLAAINAAAAEVRIPCDLEIDNGGPAPEREILDAFRRLLAAP